MSKQAEKVFEQLDIYINHQEKAGKDVIVLRIWERDYNSVMRSQKEEFNSYRGYPVKVAL